MGACKLITSNDRVVHAFLKDGTEIVRYDRAGKWYAERWDTQRQRLTIKNAATMTLNDPESHINFNMVGGTQFDRLVRVGKEVGWNLE